MRVTVFIFTESYNDFNLLTINTKQLSQFKRTLFRFSLHISNAFIIFALELIKSKTYTL